MEKEEKEEISYLPVPVEQSDEEKKKNEEQTDQTEDEKEKNKQPNGKTNWKELILNNIVQVELAIGGFVVAWYVIAYFYQLGLFACDVIVQCLFLFIVYIPITVFRSPSKISSSTEKKMMRILYWSIKFSVVILLVSFPFLYAFATGEKIEYTFPALISVFYVILSIKRITENIIPVILLAMFIMYIPFIINFGKHQNNENYYILYENNKSINKVMLTTYKDFYIVAPFDRKKKEITPQFELVEMKKDDKKDNKPPSININADLSDQQIEKLLAPFKQKEEEKKISLKLEKVGPLNVKEP
ncbi:hypothetical protein [Thermoflavimicrobium dichotomicum]|uniref:Uncharacterized protein n=1 Tax=Thermoflavimicrobium dichotomicum TaxID=46223 RepID=A0A1I3PA99_9BACL|nr:hypothetical protein [Thermoflavimicrobium dichotomicum]SFJ18468.1 hypothetical protein SAMN05421852_105153 [Thermoflavimicrobium dichotomicum]